MSKLPTCGHWVPGEDGPVLTPVPGCRTCRDATPPPKRPRCVACQRPIDTSRHHVVLSTSVQVIDAGADVHESHMQSRPAPRPPAAADVWARVAAALDRVLELGATIAAAIDTGTAR